MRCKKINRKEKKRQIMICLVEPANLLFCERQLTMHDAGVMLVIKIGLGMRVCDNIWKQPTSKGTSIRSSIGPVKKLVLEYFDVIFSLTLQEINTFFIIK